MKINRLEKRLTNLTNLKTHANFYAKAKKAFFLGPKLRRFKKILMKEPYLYFDIGKQERDSAIRFLLDAILRTKVDLGVKDVVDGFDEDVNVYLAHLLFAIALPEYHELAEPYLSNESNDVLQWVQSTDDRTIRYFIFKVNADHLLVHLAIFDDLSMRPRHGIFQRSEKHYTELGRLYYEQASTYHSRIYRKKTGVGDVLSKLARYFDIYSNVLRAVRRDYLHFVTRFRDQAFDRFMQELSRYEKESVKRLKMDHFLDLYNQWLRSRDQHVRIEINRLLDEIRVIDPEFGRKLFNE